MPDAGTAIAAARTSHDRLAGLLAPLSPDQLSAMSYDDEWTIADVASHLGSQAEIFGLFLDAALNGQPLPGGEVFGPIWDRWNALPPADQATASTAANEAFVSRLERLPADDRAAFGIELFGQQQDLGGFVTSRLAEHALHTWDIAVALDPSATVSADAVDLLIDVVPGVAGRSGKPVADQEPIVFRTTAPDRLFVLALSPEVALTPTADLGLTPLALPSEALLRLIYGRLDNAHTPAGVDDERLALLRTVFTGF